MSDPILNRVIMEANYMIDSEDTIREIAKVFNVYKITVHKDINERLKDLNINLYKNVKNILDYHTLIRHIRGGESTKKRYIKIYNDMV